jgi:L-methionine (R)-S-oxide reductase
MAETIHIPAGASRTETYEALTPQLKALLAGESDLTANAANFCALIHAAFGFHWVGFYWVRNEELVLEAFPGHIACSALSKSEIVVPVINSAAEVMGVLDIDSSELSDFSVVDKQHLEHWVALLSEACHA